MHIAIVTSEFVTEKSFSGGLANYSANLARILRENNHTVSIFVVSDIDEEIVWEHEITVYRVNDEILLQKIQKMRIPILKRLYYFLYCILGKSYVVNARIKAVNVKKPMDIVHYCNSESLSFFRLQSVPSVVRLSNYPSIWRNAYMQKFDYKKSIDDLRIEDKIQLLAIKRGDSVFAPSNAVAKLTERKIKKTVKVIESPSFIKDKSTDDSIYEKYLKGKKYFIFYGTLGYLKGTHILIEAINQMIEAGEDCYFLFIGNSQKMFWNNREILANQYLFEASSESAKCRIMYFPAIKEKRKLYSLVKHAEAVVLPHRVGNFDNTNVESMALGQIVIGTNGASHEQLIVHGENGFLVERENSKELYEKMSYVLKLSDAEKCRIRRNAEKTVERLQPNEIYEQIIEFYNQTIKKKKR